MKIVYKSMIVQLREAINCDSRPIQYIELTRSEYNQLKTECGIPCGIEEPPTTFLGIEIHIKG